VNPRQRRGVLLLVLAGLGLVAVFVLVAGYVADVRSEVDPKVEVLTLSRDVPPFRAIEDGDVTTLEMPERYAPPNAITDPAELIGLVPATALARDTVLQTGMLMPPPDLGEGQREIAIMVDAETGVAGKIGPGAIVDIVATFPAETDTPAESRVVVPRARVVEVGQAQASSTIPEPGERPDFTAQVPITFALSPREALTVTFAESFAAEVRLALRRPGDLADMRARERVYRRGDQ
jgi:pilus assembly protein CpaB